CQNTTRVLKQSFQELHASHPEFQIVSINIDKSEAMWKASVAGGKYTHPNAIDLYTDGARSKHPFIKHYDILAYPRFMLVDDSGNVISSNVYPSPQAVIRAVRAALDE